MDLGWHFKQSMDLGWHCEGFYKHLLPLEECSAQEYDILSYLHKIR